MKSVNFLIQITNQGECTKILFYRKPIGDLSISFQRCIKARLIGDSWETHMPYYWRLI